MDEGRNEKTFQSTMELWNIFQGFSVPFYSVKDRSLNLKIRLCYCYICLLTLSQVVQFRILFATTLNAPYLVRLFQGVLKSPAVSKIPSAVGMCCPCQFDQHVV